MQLSGDHDGEKHDDHVGAKGEEEMKKELQKQGSELLFWGKSHTCTYIQICFPYRSRRSCRNFV